jgi:hypothetical protein
VTALPATTVPPNHPGRLLGLVRTLIDYGRQLASTLQQRTAATNLTEFTRNFGTIDIAQRTGRAGCRTRAIPSPAARCPADGAQRRHGRPVHRPAAHAQRDRRPGSPPSGRRRYRRYLPRPRDRAGSSAVA